MPTKNNAIRQAQLDEQSQADPVCDDELIDIMVELRIMFGKGSASYTITEMLYFTKARNRSHLLLAIEMLKKVKNRMTIIRRLENGKYKCFRMDNPKLINVTNPKTETVATFATSTMEGKIIGYVVCLVWILCVLFYSKG